MPGNDLKNFLPNSHAQKYKSEYWERRLFGQHARYFGMDELQARLEYIRVARKSPSYGATLFEVMVRTDLFLVPLLKFLLFRLFLLAICLHSQPHPLQSGAFALIGAAEDGILLSKLRNSKCGVIFQPPFF